MVGFNDHVTMAGDWMPPSSSPRSFFSSMLADDVSFRSIPDLTSDNGGTLFSAPTENNMAGDEKNNGRSGADDDQSTNPGSSSEQKSSLRKGLSERMAARAGFSAPRLDTESIRPADLSQNSGMQSPYLTIPPGLSPTTLLDSPVFLSNSLVSFSTWYLSSPSKH